MGSKCAAFLIALAITLYAIQTLLKEQSHFCTFIPDMSEMENMLVTYDNGVAGGFHTFLEKRICKLSRKTNFDTKKIAYGSSTS